MKLINAKRVSILLTCAMALTLCFSMFFATMPVRVGAENMKYITAIPDSELECLSDANQVWFWSTKTGTANVRYTPTGSYTLENVTDIAFRIKNANRQTNKPNTSGGLSALYLKFKGVDTIWHLTHEQKINNEYSHFKTLAPDGTIKRTMGNTAASQFAFTANFDATAFFPLWAFYDGASIAEEDCLTSLENYQSLELEYIDFGVSTWRWDLILGDIALAKTSDNQDWTYEVMNFDKAVQEGSESLVTLRTDVFDQVALKVNGEQGVVNQDGSITANVEGVGTVSTPVSTLQMFKQATVTTDLKEGYGITNVVSRFYNANGEEITDASESLLSSGYSLGGKFNLRTNNPDNTATIGLDPVTCELDITVAPLVKVNVTGESAGVVVSHGSLDSSEGDNSVYLASGSASTLTVTPKTGFSFVEAKLNGETLTNVATEEGKFAYEVTVTEEASLEIVGVGEEVTLTVEKAEGAKATVQIGEKTFEQASEAYATNLRKILTVNVTADPGYLAKLEKVVAPAEEGAEAIVTALVEKSAGVYEVEVDGAFTLRVSTEIVTYTVTYRLNNGEMAEGEVNPESITVLDTVTLYVPVREGYEFKGWKIQGQEGYVTELANIHEDIIVVAEWERKAVQPDSSSVEEQPSSSTGEAQGCLSSVSGISAFVVLLGLAVAIFKKKSN